MVSFLGVCWSIDHQGRVCVRGGLRGVRFLGGESFVALSRRFAENLRFAKDFYQRGFWQR